MTKEEATLNTPNEMVFALAANNRDLIRYVDRNGASYRTVCNVLTGINKRRAHSNRIVRLPPAPPARPRESPAEEPQRIDFEGFVHGFDEYGLGRETSRSVSDLQDKSPSELLSTAALGEDTEEEGPSRLVWVHIPLTNTAWVNVRCLTGYLGVPVPAVLPLAYSRRLTNHGCLE
ncbi:hypothetical protein IMZ48_47390 [Candidatus Bathyarchaeota archaeon]|nr:hypothetical protein [Candidatus Bathyarchaeota archaeon]